jgi:hypothetical protein
MRSHAFCCRIFLRDLLKRFLAFLSLRDVIMKVRAFTAYFPYESSCFLAVMRCPCELVFFLLHNFCAKYPDEKSCFVGPLRALRMRFSCLFDRCAMS